MKEKRTSKGGKKKPRAVAGTRRAPSRGKPRKKKSSDAGKTRALNRAKPASTFPKKSPPLVYEAEVLRGLKPLVLRELEARQRLDVLSSTEEAVTFSYSGDITHLFRSRLIVALYRLDTYSVPRPRALLGDQQFRALSKSITEVLALHPEKTYKSFRFGAAGSDSPTFLRLAEAIRKATRLPFDPDEGDLLLRFRPAGKDWQVLTRLTPRPLSARDYRVCNLNGGLNAALAAAINKSLGVGASDRYLNAMCGSGTLAIERVLQGEASSVVGVDIDKAALACARENVTAAGMTGQIELISADACELDVPNESFDVITADVPWGDAVGSHKNNAELYPAFLKEMSRVAAPGARFGLLTHELRLFERVLKEQADWRLQRELQVWHGGHNPKLYVLKKQS